MKTLRNVARRIFNRALADCSIEQAIQCHVSVREKTLHLGSETIDLDRIQRIRIIAAGKAASAMLASLLRQLSLPAGFDLAGVLIAPSASLPLPDGFLYFPGGHPSPNEASFAGARAALTLLQTLPAENPSTTLCFFLISGGASAMMELPLDPEISVADTADFHRALVASGAAITEMNCVRKHFSAVKGGRLALAAGNSLCRSLLVSDVPIGREDVLASGPTLPDPSTVAECREILERYHLPSHFPVAVRDFFLSPAIPETPKPAEFHAHATVLLNAQALAEAAAQAAREQGFTPVIDNTCDEWEYKAAAHYLLDRLRNLRRQQPNACLISTGELSVSLPATGDSSVATGIGGRNLQFALYATTLLTSQDTPTAILSAGSDGIDGNSPAAGAVLDQNTLATENDREKARQALLHFDAYSFLNSRNSAIVTGPSGNNLRDLRIFLSR